MASQAKIVPAAGAGMPAVPDHMRNIAPQDYGTEVLEQYIIPPRLKIVQPSARKPFSEQFKQGDLVAVPGMQLVGGFNGGKEPLMQCVPVFMWVEWCVWNPLEGKGTLPVIRARTFDPRSDIAIKARDAEKREAEDCPEVPGKKLKYVEHLNWMLYPLNGPHAGIPISISFFRGSWMAGSSFSGLIRARNAPMYGSVFNLFVRERENQKGRFFVPNMDNPDGGKGEKLWVDDANLFEDLKVSHAKLKADHAKKLIIVNFDDSGDELDLENAAPVEKSQQF